jgi:hypothetical protein
MRSATTLSRLPLGSQDVWQIPNIRRFVCVDVHKPNGFEVEWTGNQGEQFQFSRMASSRKEGTVLSVHDRKLIQEPKRLTRLGFLYSN